MKVAAKFYINVGKADPYGKRDVAITCDGDLVHQDRFDVRIAFQREKCAETAWSKARGDSRVHNPRFDGEWTPEGMVDDEPWRKLADRIRAAAEEADAEASCGTAKTLELLTSAELDAGDFRIEYIIDNVLPKGECGTIAAKSKACKTHVAVELAMAAATGSPFLGYFTTPDAIRAGIISGESGKPALQEMGRRVAAFRGLTLSEVVNLIWSTTVPRLPLDGKLIERFIIDNGLQLLIVDPTYFLLRDIGDDLANATKVGAALEILSDIAHRTGCTVVLVSHNRKGRAADQRRYDPPTLEEVAGAGIDQWVRFWLLLGPRKEFDGDVGHHALWLRTGGSAGHGNLFSVDVFEGRRDDEGGRVWQPTVTTATDERKQREADKEREAIERQEQTLGDNVGKVRKALKRFSNGETARVIRSASKVYGEYFDEAIADLTGRGEVDECKVAKGGRSYDGLRWRDPWGLSGATEQSGANGNDCTGVHRLAGG